MTTVNARWALVTGTARRLAAAIFPWPSRAELDARLEAARQAKLDAERAAAAEAERLREVVGDLGEAMAALTAQLGQNKAELKAFRAGLVLAFAYVGLPAPDGLTGDRYPQEACGTPPISDYDAVSLAQARQRSMHAVRADGGRR